jgi:hypothetical protein
VLTRLSPELDEFFFPQKKKKQLDEEKDTKHGRTVMVGSPKLPTPGECSERTQVLDASRADDAPKETLL